MPKPLTADELRRAFIDFFADRGHTIVPSASVIPRRPDGAVHGRGHGAVQAVLHRRGDAAVQAGGLGAEVRPRRRQAQRPRRHRPHEPPLLVLRDARQLQLRRLLQGRGDPVGVGVLHRGARARRRPALGHRPRQRRRGRARSGATRSASPPSGSSASARTTSGGWATPARAVRRSEIFWDLGPEYGARRRSRSRRRRPLHRDLEPRVHAVRPAGRRRRWCRCRSRASTPAPASSATSWSLQGVDSIWDIDVFRPLHRRGAARRPARAYGTDRDTATSRCGSSPSTRAR